MDVFEILRKVSTNWHFFHTLTVSIVEDYPKAGIEFEG